MNTNTINQMIETQRNFFKTGQTLPVSFRITALKKLRSCILKYEKDISEAIKYDLGKSSFESYMCETGLALNELTYMIRNTAIFSSTKRAVTPLSQFYAKSYQIPSPYGIVLIMSPWNYPFLLSIGPLIDAISAGNTAIIKPSAYSPCTSAILRKIISECFPENYVKVITGGREANALLLQGHFDYIFFTGSQTVGKLVMKSAAEHLTPITLELGGKSPCIVTSSANIKLAAKRIVFGKFLNCGQTCVAPDYIYCDEKIKDSLIAELKKQISLQFGKSPLLNCHYGKIINQKHFQRILNLIESEKVVCGGNYDSSTLRIEPTIMDHVSYQDQIMSEEIFGPVLPVLTYRSLRQAVCQIQELPHPLAFYIFTSDTKKANFIFRQCGFGGGCINDTIIHLASHNMGFGGFGESGMGAYHGKAGFDTFSHYKSIVNKSNLIDLPMRYQPYTTFHNKLIHLFLS